MKYQLFPNLTADEFDALAADIKARGVMVPVEKDDEGNILDGHHRAMIADSLGIEYPVVIREGWTEDQKLVHVVALNAHRRQLTEEQRREVVATLHKARLSTRAIAKAVGVSKTTVLRDLAGGPFGPRDMHIDNPATWPAGFTDTVTGTDGKSYPAFRPRLDPLPYHPAPEPAQDYIDAMPPALAAEEREFRLRARWSEQIHKGTETLLTVKPEDFAHLLDANEREDTERLLPLLESWIARTRKALKASGSLRVVGGSK